MIVGERKFMEIPGTKIYELPPLLVRCSKRPKHLHSFMETSYRIIDSAYLLPDSAMLEPEHIVEGRREGLAINLTEAYIALWLLWQWGDGILRWTMQCETTFNQNTELKNLFTPDVWPHTNRFSLVTLLKDKELVPKGVELERALGLRLAFRRLPPINCLTDLFLLFLNPSQTASSYANWAHLTNATRSLPRERFYFQLINMDNP